MRFKFFIFLILSNYSIYSQNFNIDCGEALYEVTYHHFRESEDGINKFVREDKTVIDYDIILKNYASYLRFNNRCSTYETMRSGTQGKSLDLMGDSWTWKRFRVFKDLQTNQEIKEYTRIGAIEYTKLEPIIWEITNEESRINGLRCIKANGLRPTNMAGFKPSAYTAWFTPDIPLPFGPFDISGLPGLVVKYKWSNSVVEAAVIKNISDLHHKLKIPNVKNIASDEERITEAKKNIDKLSKSN